MKELWMNTQECFMEYIYNKMDNDIKYFWSEDFYIDFDAMQLFSETPMFLIK